MEKPLLDLEKLREIALDQHGLVTTAQALELGITKPNLSNLTRRGRLERVAHGVYRVPQIPYTQYEPYMLALLWTGASEATLSHETALDAYEVSDINPHKIHITINKGKRIRRTGGTKYILHKQNLIQEQKTWWEQMPIVRLPVAIEQCIDYGTPTYLLRQAIESGKRTGLVTAKKKIILTQKLEKRNG